MKQALTAIFTREEGGFVAFCLEVDVASQGATADEAKANRKEAVRLFFECAPRQEVRQRMADYARENKNDLLRQANEGIGMRRWAVRMARDRKLLASKQFEFTALALNECGRMAGGWQRPFGAELPLSRR